jgi:hypothetical protein
MHGDPAFAERMEAVVSSNRPDVERQRPSSSDPFEYARATEMPVESLKREPRSEVLI